MECSFKLNLTYAISSILWIKSLVAVYIAARTTLLFSGAKRPDAKVKTIFSVVPPSF